MEVILRAWRFVTRKRMKSIVLAFILLLMSTMILSGLSIKNATDQAAWEKGSERLCFRK